MFIEEYDINKMSPADYNPRKIEKEAFEKLKESLKTFGVVKPVIINQNGILIAGHQRTKAMKSVGIKYVPVFIMKNKISLADEIKFNLMHNSIETETSKIKIEEANKLKLGFSIVEVDRIKILEKAKGVYSKEIARLLNKYGEYGSVIIDEEGIVIHNSDYAFNCKIFNKKLLVYKMKNEVAKKFLEYMKIDYGSYNYETLNIKPYVQTHCQMNRSDEVNKSSTYKKLVIPNIKREERGLDFGAGKCFYANHLREQGYKIFMYEPFFKKLGSEKLDITATIKMIKEIASEIKINGLMDYVVLDSVLNSVSSNEYEEAILLTCNAMLKDSGTFYTGTRNIYKANRVYSTSTTKGRNIEFLDKDNYSVAFRKGVWTLQKFHDASSLKKLLSKFFKDVEVYNSTGSQIWAKCKKPIRFSKEKYEEALNKEFNIEYPNDYRHNQHKELCSEVLKRLFM